MVLHIVLHILSHIVLHIVLLIVLLIPRGAEIAATDHQNFTPLHTAVFHGSNVCVERLLERGAYVRVLTKADQSVIHIAASQNRVDTLRVSGVCGQVVSG